MDAAVREAGAVPAFLAVSRGVPAAGLTPDELQRFLESDEIDKASARDLAASIARGGDGSTTVAASLTLCHAAGIRVFATGGIGGVHREPAFDESADLIELARTPVVVVCSGAKAILDLRATVERLETLGITVVGFRTDEFPGFYHGSTGLRVPARVDDVDGIVRVLRAQRRLGHPAAVLVVQPPPAPSALSRDDVDHAIDAALARARTAGVSGSAMTPFLLSAVSDSTEGRSIRTNLDLLEANARLAAEVAVRLSHDDS
jgi:pseudouridine-5'-phosphate glycosidase